jgi:hypothetical protein
MGGLIRPLSQPRLTTEGADLVVRYGPGGMLPFLLLALAALALAAWLWFRKRRKLDAGLAAAFAVFILVFLVPMTAFTTIRITPTAIRQTTGFWFAPTRAQIDLSDTARVVITSRRRGRWDVGVWTFIGRDGRTQSIEPSDLWLASAPEITAELKRRGVQFD